jgi:hypothetical protein
VSNDTCTRRASLRHYRSAPQHVLLEDVSRQRPAGLNGTAILLARSTTNSDWPINAGRPKPLPIPNSPTRAQQTGESQAAGRTFTCAGLPRARESRSRIHSCYSCSRHKKATILPDSGQNLHAVDSKGGAGMLLAYRRGFSLRPNDLFLMGAGAALITVVVLAF